jgi:disulfide bond formation protein DsbB
MFQRVAVMALGVVCLLAVLHGPMGWGVRIYAFIGLVTAALGAAIAGRHVWLQSLPKDQLPSCAPPMDYMWENLPFGNMLKTVLMTSGECANVDWQLFGFSMPVWTLVFFVMASVVMLALIVFPPRRGILAR